MAAQARVLRVTTGGESPVIITARACLAPPRLLAQALVRPAGALRYTGPTWSLDRSTAQVPSCQGGAGLRPLWVGIGVRSAGWRSRRRSLPAGRVAVLPPWSHRWGFQLWHGRQQPQNRPPGHSGRPTGHPRATSRPAPGGSRLRVGKLPRQRVQPGRIRSTTSPGRSSPSRKPGTGQPVGST
jgi:hypothetical protein